MGGPTQSPAGPVVDTVLRGALTSLVQYCAAEETKRELEAKLVGPLLEHIGARFAWATRLLQGLALLVLALLLLQTALLAWLLVRDVRRRAIFPGASL